MNFISDFFVVIIHHVHYYFRQRIFKKHNNNKIITTPSRYGVTGFFFRFLRAPKSKNINYSTNRIVFSFLNIHTVLYFSFRALTIIDTMANVAYYNDEEFYLRVYMGHKSRRFGHEFMEFEVCPSGKLRYANNSNYKDDTIIRREVCLGPAVVSELKRIIRMSEITQVDDERWEEPPSARRWELEIKIGNEHICFNCAEIMSLNDIKDSPDPNGLTVLYYLTQDLKCFIMSLINLHFKKKPI